MTAATDELSAVRRTFLIRREQDEALQQMHVESRDSVTAILRRVIDYGLPIERREMRNRQRQIRARQRKGGAA